MSISVVFHVTFILFRDFSNYQHSVLFLREVNGQLSNEITVLYIIGIIAWISMLTQVTIVLATIAIAHAKHFNCVFSEMYGNSDHYRSRPAKFHERELGRRGLLTVNQQKMRISLHTDDLNTVKATANGQAQTTLPKLEFLKRSIEVAKYFFESRLKVTPAPSVEVPQLCFDYNTPQSDQDNGIVTDLRIYVLYKTDSLLSYGGTGVSCAWNQDRTYPDTSLRSGRPTVGRIIYNTYNIIDSETSLTNRLFSTLTATSLHETMHILGFDKNLYSKFMDSSTGNPWSAVLLENQILDASRSGGPNNIMVTPHVKAWAVEHFGCQTIAGMPLENEDGSTISSHWERLSIYDELMTATALGTQKSFTALSYAILKDMGWYTVDDSFNDTTNYGQNLGCSFYNHACYGSTDYDKYFCNPATYVNVTECSTTHLGKAGCSADPSLMADGCGIFVDYIHCADPDTQDYGYQSLALEVYSDVSMCIRSTFATQGLPSNYRGRCYPYSCDYTQNWIVFQVGTYTVYCLSNEAGMQKRVSALDGYLECPIFTSYCNYGRKVCKNWCSKNGFGTGGVCNCYASDSMAYSGVDCSVTSCTVDQFYNPNTSTCDSTCPSGTYQNVYSRTCMPCNSNCEECRDEPHICIGCPSSIQNPQYYYSDQSICVSQCPSETYQDNDNCIACDISVNCQTCQGSATSCTSCSGGLYLTTSTHTCGSSCTTNPDLLKDTINMVCVQSCPNDLKQQNSQCVRCDPEYKVIDAGGSTCVTDCAAGYYKDDVRFVCDNCDQSCKDCYDKYSENCTKCKTIGTLIYLYLDMCISQCPPGFYGNDTAGQCEKCTIQLHCSTCEIDNTGTVKCLSCEYGFYLRDDQTCETGCLTGYYKNMWNHSCDPCHSSCNDCTSPYSSSCLNCNSPEYFLQNVTGGFCVTQCPTEGYVADSGECQKCHETCHTCTGLTSQDCQTCSDGLYLQSNKCRYVCSSASYPDSSTRSCLPCSSKCSYCFGPSQSNCTRCIADYYLNSFTCETSCPENQSPNSYRICEMNEKSSQLLIKTVLSLSMIVMILMSL